MVWLIPQVEGLAPGARGGHAAVAVGSKVLLFGGSDRAPVTYNDLWCLDTSTTPMLWTRISPVLSPGCPPVHPRSGATLTAIGDQVYLFGGQEPLTEFRFSDLKVLDTTTWTWSEVEVAGGNLPPARHSHTACCLAGQCLILYGGSGYQGTLDDVWIFNPDANGWTRPSVSGSHPAGREMHGAAMITPTTMMIYGGRTAEGRVLDDAALLDASQMRWTAKEPTPFNRCAHCCAALPEPTTSSAPAPEAAAGSDEQAPSQASEAASTSGPSGASSQGSLMSMYVCGGFTGESVQGDVIRIDGKTLELELLHKGPRASDPPGTVPAARFGHTAAAVPWPPGNTAGTMAMVVLCGVNPAEDLNDVALWVPEPSSNSSNS